MKDFDFRINNFDFIRLIAALQVVFLHSVEHLNIPVSEDIISFISLFPGVPIFFLISGFLISASYEKSHGSIKQYFINRVLRIYPALWACFIFSLITVFIFFEPSFNTKEFLLWCVAQLSFVQFYNPSFLRDYGVGVLNGSLWTITVELQFYIAIPILYFIASKFTKKVTNKRTLLASLALAFIAFIFANYIYQSTSFTDKSLLSKLYAVSLIPHLYMFLFGIFIQRNIHKISAFVENRFFVWLVIYSIVIPICNYFELKTGGNYISLVPFLFLSALIISLAYSFNGALGKSLHRNDISYGVYIYHMIFINIFVNKGYTESYYSLALIFLLTITFGILSWIYIEKPALSLKKYSLLKN